MPNHIHIIGGGIIGLTSAWYLLDEGYEVTIIDKGDLLDGTSHGNAGMIVPSHFIPMAAPGVISQGMTSKVEYIFLAMHIFILIDLSVICRNNYKSVVLSF